MSFASAEPFIDLSHPRSDENFSFPFLLFNLLSEKKGAAAREKDKKKVWVSIFAHDIYFCAGS
jgi:hypothetical protein